MSGDPLALLATLARIPSVTPADLGCQAMLRGELQRMGFTIHHLPFGEVENFYARLGERGPNFCFAGHTDVVPAGQTAHWESDPFACNVIDGRVIGRGVCDMKGGIAAMVAACQRFLAATPELTRRGSLSFLITGDEEGKGDDGTIRVLEWLKERGETLDMCLVGEPTSVREVGDCIKHGRRGSLNGRIVVRGVQGHSAYPQLARNPIHLALPALARIAALELPEVAPGFEPSTLQVTNLHAGEGAVNVIPGQLTARFNARFNPATPPEGLVSRIRAILTEAGLDFDLETTVSGRPYLTDGGRLLAALTTAIHDVTGLTPLLSTGGGTSDSRLIVAHCPETLDFGLLSGSIHKVNEQTTVADLERLTAIYQRLLERLFPAA